MFLVGLLGWWYGNGWTMQLHLMMKRLSSIAGFFSIKQLAATLFSPYRQISAGQVKGPVGVQLRAFADRLLSRIIGAIARTLLIVIGSLLLVMGFLYESLRLVFWVLLPLLPIAGLILMVIGWVPRWM